MIPPRHGKSTNILPAQKSLQAYLVTHRLIFDESRYIHKCIAGLNVRIQKLLTSFMSTSTSTKLPYIWSVLFQIISVKSSLKEISLKNFSYSCVSKEKMNKNDVKMLCLYFSNLRFFWKEQRHISGPGSKLFMTRNMNVAEITYHAIWIDY